ncbi:unnamed protein product [Danaus chrysippus]|uniref:Cilia- and flagella-associated protein 91 n=1 Tax=Danaus chrysippus TaxID=151541 RepID=A0A8J2QW45_9NEOP|nr:unnamed protein product [Danaus chrysippus]
MSGDTIYEAPRRFNVSKMRVHDYLYDSTYIVSGARDYARTAFKAAMASAQVVIQPVYKTMFSELRQFPRMQVVYHPNCRLPGHIDRSYRAYLERTRGERAGPLQLGGKDRFKFTAMPKKLLNLKSATPDFHPTTPHQPRTSSKPRNRGTQSLYRESSAQTIPWGPDAKVADNALETPEVMYLDALEWGPGCPYRLGDLPADFHTTEIINKMRHARKWNEIVEKGQFPNYMKKQNAIITDVETKDWIFREAEIDELQDIRLALLNKLKSEQQQKRNSRISTKLAKLWADKKDAMEQKIDKIRRTRDRELRKLSSRGRGRKVVESEHAPLARLGYRASRRHAEIIYDPSLLVHEDHRKLAEPPAWLEQCGQNLTKSCSGHHLPRDVTQLCERETKWSEQFLANLHSDLKKARLGAAKITAGPLRVLRPRQLPTITRPPTPEVEGVGDDDESAHQAALVLQRVIRGRAVQVLMFEGRTRAAELTEELKTTHGLQREDRERIAREESKARDYQALRAETEQKEQAISSLVQELCGGAVSAALDFLEKELRRLREERRQHAFILIALREKTMREAAEAGRRQKEEHRRREHDEIFKRVLGVTQETVDAYLQDVLLDGVALAAEEDAVRKVLSSAEKIEKEMADSGSISTAEQNEVVAELVQQFLLPEAHKTASRHKIATIQKGRLEGARASIMGVLIDAENVEATCPRCGRPLDEQYQCIICKPTATTARDDPRWKHSRRREVKEKSLSERYPVKHEIRCMLNTLIYEAVETSRSERRERESITRYISSRLREEMEVNIDVVEIINEAIAVSTGELIVTKRPDYHYYMTRICEDALERTIPFGKPPCPKELPSEIRRKVEEAAALEDPTCRCDDDKSKVKFGISAMDVKAKSELLPSELRILEELRRCKCDTSPSPSPIIESSSSNDFSSSDFTDAIEEEGNENQ